MIYFRLVLLIVSFLNLFCYRLDDFEWPVERLNNLLISSKVIWGNNEFVISDGGSIHVSIDGQNWNELPDQSRANRNLAWGSGTYVSVGYDI